MTQRFADDGKVMPVTVVKAGPCHVTQVKTKENDGYQAVQLGFGSHKINKPAKGHLKGLPEYSSLAEFVEAGVLNLKRGDILNVQIFQPGEMVNVTGISKGKGFQGVVKRHGFKGHRTTHGTKDQVRMPGSIGSTDPQRVFKGMRMAGHMGNAQASVKNLEIIEIDAANDLLFIKGALPGARHSLVRISAAGEIKLAPTEKNETVAAPAPAEKTADKEKTPAKTADKKKTK